MSPYHHLISLLKRRDEEKDTLILIPTIIVLYDRINRIFRSNGFDNTAECYVELANTLK